VQFLINQSVNQFICFGSQGSIEKKHKRNKEESNVTEYKQK